MSSFYNPIDSSNLSEVILEEDDNLYSTLCKAIVESASGGKLAKWIYIYWLLNQNLLHFLD